MTEQAPHRLYLREDQIPTQWYNLRADMPEKPEPIRLPNGQVARPEDLASVFCDELVRQELDDDTAYVDIPEPVLEMYRIYRPSPLCRAYNLEKALGTPAKIYYKFEGNNTSGSHKLNSAIAQAYYAKAQDLDGITTETGAGQWGTALAEASAHFGLNLDVFMVKCSYEQKPFRRNIMETFDAHVTPSPSDTTEIGRKMLAEHPDSSGSLGTAISEAVELAMQTPNCKYTLGSVLNHVMLHQTVIGLEAEKQMEMAGEYPDVVIGCFGGGSNFSGITFPFLRHKLTEGKDIRVIAAEPASCPKLTRGQFQYDFGDEAGYTPLIPMFTLGHNFSPANIHAGGLRYHGAGSIVSQLMKDELMSAVDIKQLDTFKAATLFAQAEGIIPAPESSHAIAAAIHEAEQAKIEGKPRTILFNLSGHGLIDMAAYDQYLSGDLTNYEVTDEEVANNLKDLEKII